ncbi:MAG: sigma 54-interacting transcriptional regulator [Gemmataceae bacterium]
MADAPEPNRKGRPKGSRSFAWRAFFQQSTTPIFVLGKTRRLRFANTACEQLIGMKLADALGMVCSERRHSSPLAAALAPTPEAQAGKPDKVRRAAPTGRNGPPWWDISFMPLMGEGELLGIVGFITVIGDAIPAAARRVPISITALREKHATWFTLDLFAGTSAASLRLQTQLRHAAESTAPLWLVGEAGTGKETAARTIHHSGRRRNAAFVGLDCAGLQPYLLESLLFGHGGILGTEHVGTLFLKEPAALPRDLQQRFADLVLQNARTPRDSSRRPREQQANQSQRGSSCPTFTRRYPCWRFECRRCGTASRSCRDSCRTSCRVPRSKRLSSMCCNSSRGPGTCGNSRMYLLKPQRVPTVQP